MTADAPIFTPEIEELLREIAAEPDSVLLRVPREKVKATLLETRSPIGPMTAGLSSAERELVQVHREEFAFQLRRASWIKLTTDKPGKLFFSRRADSFATLQVPEAVDVEHGTRASLEFEDAAAGYKCLDWVSLPLDAWPNVTELCAVAQRCAPTNQNRLYAGTDWALRGNYRTAIELFSAVLANPCSFETAGTAFSQIGFCYDAMGRLFASVDAWRSAHHAVPHRQDVLCFWFGLAIRAGVDGDIFESNVHISEAFGKGRGTLAEHASLLQNKRTLGYWVSDHTSARSLQRWNSRLCESAKELAHAFE